MKPKIKRYVRAQKQGKWLEVYVLSLFFLSSWLHRSTKSSTASSMSNFLRAVSLIVTQTSSCGPIYSREAHSYGPIWSRSARKSFSLSFVRFFACFSLLYWFIKSPQIFDLDFSIFLATKNLRPQLSFGKTATKPSELRK